MIPPPPTFPLFPYTTLFRSLGFHKQMDNRIKLLEEILSFRMQGVEFDNGEKKKDRKSGSAGMPRPTSYAVFCSKKKKRHTDRHAEQLCGEVGGRGPADATQQ